MKERYAQGADLTSLYSANTRQSGSEVRGHGLVVGRGEKPILRFLLGLFWGKCSARMAYHPKEANLSWDH